MKVNAVHYDAYFKKQFKKLPNWIKVKANLKEKMFKNDPFHPSLRLHKLKGKLNGYWSISVDMGYRIIFLPTGDGNILFVNIGRHAIYDD